MWKFDINEDISHLLDKFERVRFSKSLSAKLIGREALERYVGNGRIRRERPNATSQHGKWFCNASDVIRILLTM